MTSIHITQAKRFVSLNFGEIRNTIQLHQRHSPNYILKIKYAL